MNFSDYLLDPSIPNWNHIVTTGSPIIANFNVSRFDPKYYIIDRIHSQVEHALRNYVFTDNHEIRIDIKIGITEHEELRLTSSRALELNSEWKGWA